MCGRYGRSSDPEAIRYLSDSLTHITEASWKTTYNAATGVLQPIVRVKPDGGRSTICSVL